MDASTDIRGPRLAPPPLPMSSRTNGKTKTGRHLGRDYFNFVAKRELLRETEKERERERELCTMVWLEISEAPENTTPTLNQNRSRQHKHAPRSRQPTSATTPTWSPRRTPRACGPSEASGGAGTAGSRPRTLGLARSSRLSLNTSFCPVPRESGRRLW